MVLDENTFFSIRCGRRRDGRGDNIDFTYLCIFYTETIKLLLTTKILFILKFVNFCTLEFLMSVNIII